MRTTRSSLSRIRMNTFRQADHSSPVMPSSGLKDCEKPGAPQLGSTSSESTGLKRNAPTIMPPSSDFPTVVGAYPIFRVPVLAVVLSAILWLALGLLVMFCLAL